MTDNANENILPEDRKAEQTDNPGGTNPREVVERVQEAMAVLRENLLKREADDTEAFERIFDEQNSAIASDLELIDSLLMVKMANDRRYAKIRKDFEEQKKELEEMKEAQSIALAGTDCNTVMDLRAKLDEFRDTAKKIEIRTVAKPDCAIVPVAKSERYSDLRELVSETLEAVRCKDLFELVALVEDQRVEIQRLDGFLVPIANLVQVDHAEEIMDSVNGLYNHRNELLEKVNEMEQMLKTEASVSRENARVVVKGQTVRTRPVIPLSQLGEMPKYEGDNMGWSTFESGFLLRFGHLGDDSAKVILEEKLEGRAKQEYRSLPNEYENKSVEDCLEWLKNRLRGGSMYQEVHLTSKLRNQNAKGRKADEVCHDLEKWIDQLYAGDGQREVEKQRQLIQVYSTNKEYYKDLLRLLDEKASYEVMKNHLLRMEWLEKQYTFHGKHSSGGVSNDSPLKLSSMIDVTCESCQGKGHDQENCPNKKSKGGRFAEMKCYVCDGMGHTSRVCTSEKKKEDL